MICCKKNPKEKAILFSFLFTNKRAALSSAQTVQSQFSFSAGFRHKTEHALYDISKFPKVHFSKTRSKLSLHISETIAKWNKSKLAKNKIHRWNCVHHISTMTSTGCGKKSGPLKFFAVFSATVWNF